MAQKSTKSALMSVNTLLLGGAVVLAFVFGFFGGTLWKENQLLRSGFSGSGTQPSTQAAAQPAAAAPSQATTGTASVDDDPFLGDENAPITIIEFSDFECPFCKRFFDETLPDLKTNYIDTGKVKMVYRDLPLSFHEPMSTRESIAANCARVQGGDDKYFEYHDEIFSRTISNGNGLSPDDLTSIATDIGLNLDQFTTCQEDPDQEAEVKNDLADAGKAGATGTPSFVIGKTTSDGVIVGKLVVGAQPFSAFEAVLKTLE